MEIAPNWLSYSSENITVLNDVGSYIFADSSNSEARSYYKIQQHYIIRLSADVTLLILVIIR